MRILVSLVAICLIVGGCSGDKETVRQRTVDIDSVLIGATDLDVRVMFVGGPVGLLNDDPCAGEYEVDVVESADEVEITIHALVLATDEVVSCTLGGTFREISVELVEPIGARLLADGHDDTPQTVLDAGSLLWPHTLATDWILRSRDAGTSNLRASYGTATTNDDGITIGGGPIDESSWNMDRAVEMLGEIAEPITVRGNQRDGALLITSQEASTISVAFDEDGNHYRVTAYGSISTEALLAFVDDLALDPLSRSFEIPFAADFPVPEGPAPVPRPTATPTPAGAPALEPVPLAQEPAWSVAESTRDAANYLEALRQGAFEQAAWPLSNNGMLFNGQLPDETGAEFLERSCAPDLCNGPYLIRAQPGYVSPTTGQATASVSVMHLASGEEGHLLLFTFEGQRMIGSLPPLVNSENDASLRTSLFDDRPPQHVVVERFDSFEIWNGSATTWVTNWHAAQTQQVEGGVISTGSDTFGLERPELLISGGCPQLLERQGRVLARNQCIPNLFAIVDATSGEAVDPAVDYEIAGESSSPWYYERAGVVVVGERDAEGNLNQLLTNDGVDLIDGDYASIVAISTDGQHVAYVDHSDPAASSHFSSPVVVVRVVASGEEIGRWTLAGPVTCLEFAVEWVVACEADEGTVPGLAEQASLAAIDLTTGQVNRVATSTSIFLPINAG